MAMGFGSPYLLPLLFGQLPPPPIPLLFPSLIFQPIPLPPLSELLLPLGRDGLLLAAELSGLLLPDAPHLFITLSRDLQERQRDGRGREQQDNQPEGPVTRDEPEASAVAGGRHGAVSW
jgi:hypothetical protein